jgi:hypothetical protein
MGPILDEAETIFYGLPRLREQTLQTIRFDVRDREEVTRGMSVASLELGGDRATFDLLRHTPQERLAATGAAQRMGLRARRLVESASGLCVITKPEAAQDPQVDVTVGRCMQRAWLALTRRGLVAHPMSTVQMLADLADAPGEEVPETDRIRSLVSKFRAAYPSVDKGSSIAILMRFGWAPPPTTLVRRLALQESVAGDVTP